MSLWNLLIDLLRNSKNVCSCYFLKPDTAFLLLLGKEVEWEGQEAYTGALPFTRLHSKHFFTPLPVLAYPSVSLCIRFPLLCSLLRECDSDKALLKSSFTTGPLQRDEASGGGEKTRSECLYHMIQLDERTRPLFL